MGRMKEIYIQILNANDGIPEGMTVQDVAKMREWNIYQWQEYEREAEKRRLQHNQSEDPGEVAKVKQAAKKFSANYGEARKSKED